MSFPQCILLEINTRSMIAISASDYFIFFGNFGPKLHSGNVANMPCYKKLAHAVWGLRSSQNYRCKVISLFETFYWYIKQVIYSVFLFMNIYKRSLTMFLILRHYQILHIFQWLFKCYMYFNFQISNTTRYLVYHAMLSPLLMIIPSITLYLTLYLITSHGIS